jgi:hypothetical protein
MKKQYINPETTVVVLNTQCQLMAGSITERLKTTEVDDDMDFVQCSRGFDLWDDDEE